MTLVLLLVATILCTSLAQVLQKRLSLCLTEEPVKTGENIVRKFKLAMLFTHSFIWLGLGLVLWFFVLSKMEVSIAYPILSLNVVVVMFLSSVIFGEKISLHQIVGAAAILSGVVLLTSGTMGASIL